MADQRNEQPVEEFCTESVTNWFHNMSCKVKHMVHQHMTLAMIVVVVVILLLLAVCLAPEQVTKYTGVDVAGMMQSHKGPEVHMNI